jgi:hypothetical protein
MERFVVANGRKNMKGRNEGKERDRNKEEENEIKKREKENR